MKRIALALLTLLVVAAAAPRAQDVDKLFKAAMNTELVDGNLPAAIEQYKKVVQTGSRALAAQALVRMAECYQKLGDAESRKIYERLVRDYADQKESAAIARARLGEERTRQPKTMALRKVWSGPNIPRMNAVSPRMAASLPARHGKPEISACMTFVTAPIDCSQKTTGQGIIPPVFGHLEGRQAGRVLVVQRKDRYELRLTGLQPPRHAAAHDSRQRRHRLHRPVGLAPDGESVVVRVFRKDLHGANRLGGCQG